MIYLTVFLAIALLSALVALDTTSRRLRNLRSNAYLTDKSGIRRRYSLVPHEVRDAAER